MSNIIQQAGLLISKTPLIQFQRLRGKINIQRPRQPHYQRALLNAVTQPRYPEPDKTSTCFKRNPNFPPEVHNPYNDIISREVLNWLNHSRMVAIFHLNSLPQDELFRTRVALHKSNMHLKSYGKKIIAQAIRDTKFEAILPLFESQHCIVFSSEQNVKQLLRIVRKAPQLILLGGIVDGRLLSRNELVEYSQLPGLQQAQAELVQTLNMAAGNLVQQLEAHQKNFVNILDVYAKSAESNSTEGEVVAKSKEEQNIETEPKASESDKTEEDKTKT